METIHSILIILGTLLPIIGSGLTIFLARHTQGAARWSILAILPVVTLAVCWLAADVVWQDGNVPAAALFMIYLVALVFYYPVLAFSAIVMYRGKPRGQHGIPAPGDRPE